MPFLFALLLVVALTIVMLSSGGPARCPTKPDTVDPSKIRGPYLDHAYIDLSSDLERRAVGFIRGQLDDPVVAEVLEIEDESEKRFILYRNGSGPSSKGYHTVGDYMTGGGNSPRDDGTRWYKSITVRFRVDKPERYDEASHEYDEAYISLWETSRNCKIVESSSWIVDPEAWDWSVGPPPPGIKPREPRTGPSHSR